MGVKAYLDGILGEDKACKFLKKQGFEILKRNFHSKFGEIDIIAKKDEILHFIEVKFTQKEYLNNNVRDYTDVETPCSIPNQEAKHIVGDDTTPYWQGESSSLRTC